MKFFVGMDDVHHADNVGPCFISVNRLRKRKAAFKVGDWIMDSGAFTEVARHGGYVTTVPEHASEIRRWAGNGNLLAAVAQDYMCEPWVVAKTGLSVHEHQRLTVERYDALMREDVAGVYVMPVLQGYRTSDYVRHLAMYGDRFAQGAWVGVGSVCKRNGDPEQVYRVLASIQRVRPDLKLHGFGLKLTAVTHPGVRSLLHSSDSMAWSFAARYEGRSAHDWNEAARYASKVNELVCSPTARRPRVPIDDGFFNWGELGA